MKLRSKDVADRHWSCWQPPRKYDTTDDTFKQYTSMYESMRYVLGKNCRTVDLRYARVIVKQQRTMCNNCYFHTHIAGKGQMWIHLNIFFFFVLATNRDSRLRFTFTALQFDGAVNLFRFVLFLYSLIIRIARVVVGFRSALLEDILRQSENVVPTMRSEIDLNCWSANKKGTFEFSPRNVFIVRKLDNE